MKRLVLVGLVLLSLVFAPTALAKPNMTQTRVEGLWITTDCLTGGPPGTPAHTLDCDGSITGVPGDASAMSLFIGPGASPALRFVDTYATFCADTFGQDNVRYVATGYGVYTTPPETEARTLTIFFTDAHCGSEAVATDPEAENGLYFCCQENDPRLDNLWDDFPLPPDFVNTDWGTLWVRAQ